MMASKRSFFRRIDDALCAFATGHSVDALKADMLSYPTGEMWHLANRLGDGLKRLSPAERNRRSSLLEAVDGNNCGLIESNKRIAEAILLDFFEVFFAPGRVRKPMIFMRRELVKHVLDGRSRPVEALLVALLKLDSQSDESVAKEVGLQFGLDEQRFGAGYGHIASFLGFVRRVRSEDKDRAYMNAEATE